MWESMPVRPIWQNYKQLKGLEEVAFLVTSIFNFFWTIDVTRQKLKVSQGKYKKATRANI
jgi:hypothetical protein